jgi:hypothetical protein
MPSATAAARNAMSENQDESIIGNSCDQQNRTMLPHSILLPGKEKEREEKVEEKKV